MLLQYVLCMIVLLKDIVYTILHYILIIVNEREITVEQVQNHAMS